MFARSRSSKNRQLRHARSATELCRSFARRCHAHTHWRFPHRRPRLCRAMHWAIGRKPFKGFEEDKVPVLSQRWKWVRRPKGSAGSESCGQFMGLRHKSLLHCACCAYALRCATCPSVCGNTDEHRLELLPALLRRSLLVLYTRQNQKMHGALGFNNAAAQSGSPDQGSTYAALVPALASRLHGQGHQGGIPTVSSKRALT